MELKMGILERMLRSYLIALCVGLGVISAVWLSLEIGPIRRVIQEIKCEVVSCE